MAAAQELRDGEEELGDVCQTGFYGVFLEDIAKRPDFLTKPGSR